MTIKSKDSKSVVLENSHVGGEVSFEGSSVYVHLNSSESEMDFKNPGEYEFKGVDIIAREVLVGDKFLGDANSMKITMDGVRILFLANGIEAKQDDLNIILDIDILVLQSKDLANIDRLVMLYNPKKVIILSDKKESSSVEESLKKSFSTSQISIEKQVKSKQEEYSSENFVVSFYVFK